MATKNNRRTLITKKILKDSLLQLMQDKPITRITIKEICELSEMSRSTFYLHYRDQYELLNDIEEEVLYKTFENLKNLGAKLNTARPIEHFLDYVRDNSATFSILLCHPENASFQKAIMERVREYIRTIVPTLNSSERDLLLYSFMMQGSLSAIIGWIESDFMLPSKEVAGIIYKVCDSIVKISPNQGH